MKGKENFSIFSQLRSKLCENSVFYKKALDLSRKNLYSFSLPLSRTLFFQAKAMRRALRKFRKSA